MFWSGVALSGLFLINTAATILPLALLKPEWQLNTTLTLQSNGLQALIGCALLSAAPLIDPANQALRKTVAPIRRIAAWICLGWLLLIPLQLTSSRQVLSQSRSTARQELRRFEQQIDVLRQVRDEQSFRVQFALMAPTSPPFPERLPASLDRVRDEAVNQFLGQLRRQQANLSRAIQQSIQANLIQTLRNSLLCLILALGFASIGRWQKQGPTVLTELIQWVDPNHPGSLSQRSKAGLQRLRKRFKRALKSKPSPAPTRSRRNELLAKLRRRFDRYQRKRRARQAAEKGASRRRSR